MSMFGDDDKGNNKNYLFSALEDFFRDGGTWRELFEVLENFCEFGDYTDSIKVSDE